MAVAIKLNAEMYKHRAWTIGSVLAGLAATMLVLALQMPVKHVIDMTRYYWVSGPVVEAAGKNIQDFYREWWSGIFSLKGIEATLSATIEPVDAWADDPLQAPPIVVVAFAIGLGLTMLLATRCPYAPYRTSHGKARPADMRTLRREKLLSHTGFILGNFNGHWVRSYNTLSAILLAPPGTGKTVQLIANILADWPDRILRPWAAGFAVVGALVGAWSVWSFLAIGASEGAAAIGVVAGLYVLYEIARIYGPADMPGPNFIINDVKGEIRDATIGWRSQLGPCFTLAWGGLDESDEEADSFNPLDLDNLPNGDRLKMLRDAIIARLDTVYFERVRDDERIGHGAAALPALVRAMYANKSSGRRGVGAFIRNPRLADRAPIDDSVDVVAAMTAAARLRIDGRTLAADVQDYAKIIDDLQKTVQNQTTLLIPDTIEAHWRNTGRAAGIGFILFHIEQCIRLGRVPSYGGLLDWLTQVTPNAGFADLITSPLPPSDGATRPDGVAHSLSSAITGDTPREGNGGQADGDKLQALLEEAVEEARIYGYSDRVVSELNDLLNKPDKERGSVVSTFGSAIAVFKSPSVRARTSSSSFTIKQMRGMPIHGRQTGRWGASWYETRPVTVYVAVKLEDAEFYGRVTALFFDLVMNTFLSQPARQVKKARPIALIPDEFWSLPPMKSTMTVVTLGRGQRLMEKLVGQSYGQLGMQFGAQGALVIDTMKDAFHYTLVPTQASVKTSEEISKTIGMVTVPNDNMPLGPSPHAKGLAGIFASRGGSRSWTGVPLYSDQAIRGLEMLDPLKGKKGEQLVLINGMKHIPIKCRPPVYFWDRTMRARSQMSQTLWKNFSRDEAEEILDEFGVPLEKPVV